MPTSLFAAPIIHQGNLLGAIEIGSFEAIGDPGRVLIDALLPVIAINLENLMRASRTRELLEQTQAQAQKLVVSEEELRASNEELREKTEALERQTMELRASEESLTHQREELQASNEELREKTEAVQAAQAVIEEKARQLELAGRYKSEFLANMSHELRTPLNSLLILSKTLTDNEEGNLTEDQRESAAIIHESGSDLLRLINDILDLSKIEAGKTEIHLDEFAPSALAATLGRRFRPVAEQKDLEFEVKLSDGLPETLISDPVRVDQVLNNLLSNAFKFTASGRVTLGIERPSPGVRVPTWDGNGARAVAFSVTDTGIGIPTEQMERIFHAFEQVDGTTARRFGGTGLGLSISRELTWLLGGGLQVESVEGAGSTFTLYLPEQPPEGSMGPARPVAKREPPIVPASAEIPKAPTAAICQPSIADDRDIIGVDDKSVLIIEDDLGFARILADLARNRGFKCLAAADGESGLELARQYLPTGIVLDVGLPGMDGWTVMARLKEAPETRHIPVHFISATSEPGRGMDKGAVGYLTKPVTRDEIERVLERIAHFAAGKVRHLLVVEDDPASRSAIERLVASGEVDIKSVGSGEEALEALQKEAFDCIILDLGLPAGGGLFGPGAVHGRGHAAARIYRQYRHQGRALLRTAFGRSDAVPAQRPRKPSRGTAAHAPHHRPTGRPVRRQEGPGGGRRHAERLRPGQGPARPGIGGSDGQGRVKSVVADRGAARRGYRADGHHDARHGRLRGHPGNPKAGPFQRSSHSRDHRQGHARRPREVPGGRGQRLSRQAHRHGQTVVHDARLAVGARRREMGAPEIEDMEVNLFVEALRLRHGYDFSNYAKASLKRRVLGLCLKTGSENVSAMVPRIMHDREFLGEVLAGLSVPVTEMFRDPSAFLALRRDVVPVLKTFPHVNIWQAGCATGEEVCSLAIMLHEEGLLERTQIYATDINDDAIHQAEQGVYPAKVLEDCAENYRQAGGTASLEDYFHSRYDYAKIHDGLRRNTVFAHHNLVSDGVFCEVHMVLCRNVMIYFNKALQNRVLRLFRDSLGRVGYICLGTKETLRFSDVEEDFEPLGEGKRNYLVELLDQDCRIRVREVAAFDTLAPGCAHVAPPDYHVLVEGDGTFSLSVDPPVLNCRPSIDVTFESAADAIGPGLVGVLMTGANRDGVRGLSAIRCQGGLTLVQDPATAEASAMPEAAIRADAAMNVAPLEEIAEQLKRIGMAAGSARASRWLENRWRVR